VEELQNIDQISDSTNRTSHTSQSPSSAIEKCSNNQLPNSLPLHFAGLSSLVMDIEHLQALISVLEIEFGPVKQKMDQLFSNKKTGFDFLWCLFPIGSEIIFQDPNSGLPCAGTVHSLLFSVF